jgi:hypothetical protein
VRLKQVAADCVVSIVGVDVGVEGTGVDEER